MRACTLALIALLLSSCQTKPTSRDYKIERDGGPETTDRTEFEYSNTVSLKKTQRYKITVMAGPSTPDHYLIANVTRRTSGETEYEGKLDLIPVTSGSATYECAHYFSMIGQAEEKKSGAPSCTFALRGYVDMTGGARLLGEVK